NTNKMNLELYSVLAEVDGMGFPLAYMLLTTATAITDGINPTFVMTDKDLAQISAVKTIWPDAYIQLCLWHLKRAIKRQLGLKKKPKKIRYLASTANAEFSFIDIDFYPKDTSQQPTVQENFAFDDNESNNNEINNLIQPNIQLQNKKMPFTFCPPKYHNHIINLVTKHFNQHPYIPADDMQYYSPDQIREAAIKEIYTYCKNNNLKWVWSYLWVEWYSSSKWPTWAQSAKKEVSVLKTTMIVESHWRLIKHNYINKFNKPCVDLLVWILAERLLPRYIIKIRDLESNHKSRTIASWRPAFKRDWKTCSKKVLVKPTFFNEVKRYRSPPFWRHKDLIPLDKGLEPIEDDESYDLGNELDVNISVENEQFNDETDNDLVEQLNNETDDKLVEALQEYEESENDNNFFEEEVNNRVGEKLQKWIDLLKSQEQYKDVRFLIVAEDAMNGIEKMLTKCETLKNRRTLPRMWKDCDKQTMFYKF
ncbi:15606_t:CDS:2, partial [Gigaspora rosea]